MYTYFLFMYNAKYDIHKAQNYSPWGHRKYSKYHSNMCWESKAEMTVGTDKSSNRQGSLTHRDISVTIFRNRNATNADQVLKLQERRGGRALKMLCLCLTLVCYQKHNPQFVYVWEGSPNYSGTLTNNTSQQFSAFFNTMNEIRCPVTN